MSDIYGAENRAFQDAFDTRRLADLLEKNVNRTELTEMDQRFIASCDMVFLSTLDAQGFPTVSYKGGDRGFVRVLDTKTLALPFYDGNGMFYTAGNIAASARVGLLFIDFETPRRLRVHGTAEVGSADDLRGAYPGAQLIAQIRLSHLFTNCGRYIHKYTRVAASEYLPDADGNAPVPEWKSVDYLQEALPKDQQDRVRKAGATITEEEYRRNFWRGL